MNNPETINRCSIPFDDRTEKDEPNNGNSFLIQIPCNNGSGCVETTASVKKCYDGTTVIFSTNRKAYGKGTQRQISLDKLTSTLVNIYWKELDALLQNVHQFHEADYPALVRIWRKIGNNILHAIALFLALILLILFKVSRHRCQRQLDEVERTVSNLNDIIWQ